MPRISLFVLLVLGIVLCLTDSATGERLDSKAWGKISTTTGPPRPGAVEAQRAKLAQQEAIAREKHEPPVAAQRQHIQEARGDRELRASVNQGKPRVAATPKPAEFRDAVPAKAAGAPYRREDNRAARGNDNGPNSRADNNSSRADNNNDSPGNNQHPTHVRDLPPASRPAAPNTGDAKRDQKMQQQQEKLQAKQDQERQKLQQRQEREDQQLQQRKADDPRRQQTEQRHQQQTQQLEQKHEQQQQKWQPKEPPQQRNESRPPKDNRPPNKENGPPN